MAVPVQLFVLVVIFGFITATQGYDYDLMPKPKECRNRIGEKKCEGLLNNKYKGKLYDMCFGYSGMDDCCQFCVQRLACENGIGNKDDLINLKIKYMYLTVECKDTMKYSQCVDIHNNVYKKDIKAMCKDKKYAGMCCTFCKYGVGKDWNHLLIDEWMKHPYKAIENIFGGYGGYGGYGGNGKNGKYDDGKKDMLGGFGYDGYDDKVDDYMKDMFDSFDYADKDGKGDYDTRKDMLGYGGYDGKVDDYVKDMLNGFGYGGKDGKGDYGDKDDKYDYDIKKDMLGYGGYGDKVYGYIKDMFGGYGYGGKDGKGDYGNKNGKGDYGNKNGKGDYGNKNGKGDYGNKNGKGDYGNKNGKGDYGNKNGKGDYGNKNGKGDYGNKNGKGDYGDIDIKKLLDGFRYGGKDRKSDDYIKKVLDGLGIGNFNGFNDDDYYDKFINNGNKGSGYKGSKKDYLRRKLTSNGVRDTIKMDNSPLRKRRDVDSDEKCRDSIGEENCRKMMMNKYYDHGGMPHIFCSNPHNVVSCCRFCSTALAEGADNRKLRELAFQGKGEYPEDEESEPCEGDSLSPGKCNQIVYSMFKGSRKAMCATIHYGNVCCHSCRRYATL
ncbi:uncharacterized protein LOC117336280 [Pecten maximus]|uniref:uncharacterized protein LOC117336280 n=1 Tax=Pecten maximus TaxID=6579 RepID=UPI00145887E4|nr:uncharacterized protein LOC117336280 [Pecten maximus]